MHCAPLRVPMREEIRSQSTLSSTCAQARGGAWGTSEQQPMKAATSFTGYARSARARPAAKARRNARKAEAALRARARLAAVLALAVLDRGALARAEVEVLAHERLEPRALLVAPRAWGARAARAGGGEGSG